MMRAWMSAAALIVTTAATASTAAADPFPHAHSDSWFELTALVGRVDQDGIRWDAALLGFGPRIAIRRNFYFGAELDIGKLTGAYSSALAIKTGPAGNGTDPLSSTTNPPVAGWIAIGKVVLGARGLVGRLSGAAELAVGVRDVSSFDYIDQSVDVYIGPAVEAHVRGDAWLTSRLTLGVAIGVSVVDRGEANVGIALGWHFVPFDALK